MLNRRNNLQAVAPIDVISFATTITLGTLFVTKIGRTRASAKVVVAWYLGIQSYFATADFAFPSNVLPRDSRRVECPPLLRPSRPLAVSSVATLLFRHLATAFAWRLLSESQLQRSWARCCLGMCWRSG